MTNHNRRVTRADVAEYANVSETIVSYVLNNNRYVSQEKKERVLAAVERLNYRPSNVARALKGMKSNQIIFIADQITNEYFSRIVSEMDRYAYDKGYLISLCANRNTSEFVSQVISRQYDGIIISSSSFPDEYVWRFVEADIPLVLFLNRQYQDIPSQVGVIDSGLYSGARDCVKHLLHKGRKNLLYLDKISSKGNRSSDDDLRLSGFLDQMKASGLDLSDNRIISGCRSEDELEQAIIERIQSGMRVDGIFGRNDRLAYIAISAMGRLNMRIPEDVAIIGFDNSSFSRYCQPKLTTMEMQREAISETAIDMLQDMINGERSPRKKSFSTKLIEREST